MTAMFGRGPTSAPAVAPVPSASMAEVAVTRISVFRFMGAIVGSKALVGNDAGGTSGTAGNLPGPRGGEGRRRRF